MTSPVAHAENLAACDQPDAAALAAAYAFGLARNHPFIEGNKRIALVALESFLMLNGLPLAADDGQAVMSILSVAAGSFTEDELGGLIRKNVEPL